MECEHYRINSNEAIGQQVRNTIPPQLYLGAAPQDSIFHPINAQDIERQHLLQKKKIKEGSDWNIFWKEKWRDETDPAIKWLQRFSYKSHVSMSAEASKFYSLHVALLNFADKQ